MTEIIKYSDPTLRKVASEILRLEKMGNIGGRIGIPVNSGILDLRLLLAQMIINTMIWRDKRLNRKISSEKYLALGEKIAQSIPDSFRWKMGHINKITMENYITGKINTLTNDEIDKINIEEKRMIGLIAWYDSWKRDYKYSEDMFQNIIQNVRVKNLFNFGKVVIVPEKISKNPEAASKIIFTESQIQTYLAKMGAKFEAFVLRKADIQNIRLKEYSQGFIPVFFEKEDYRYQSEFRLMQANKIESLCYAVPKAKSAIIDGAFKGRIFEKFVCSILTGDIVIEEEKSSFYTADLYFRESNFHEKSINKFYNTVGRGRTCGIKLKIKNFPSLEDLIYILGETDIDLLLVQNNQPKHVLLGECCFTKDYNEDGYQSHLSRLKTIYNFLQQNPQSITELGVPEGYPIVPVLITSFIGEIHMKKDSIKRISYLTILRDGIKHIVRQHLENNRSSNRIC